jgi:hypothetical protein
MVEIFKTNITKDCVAENVLQELLKYFPDSIINFDLEDCDKILRVENGLILPETIIKIVHEKGFECDILE